MIQRFFSATRQCLCAFCRSPRKVIKKRRLTWMNVLYSALLALLLMFIFWQGLDGRVFLFFLIHLVLAEAFIQIRWRLSLPCPRCGFDPVLYVQSPDRAAKRVSQFLDRQRQRADYYLRRPSPLEENIRLRSIRKPNGTGQSQEGQFIKVESEGPQALSPVEER